MHSPPCSWKERQEGQMTIVILHILNSATEY